MDAPTANIIIAPSNNSLIIGSKENDLLFMTSSSNQRFVFGQSNSNGVFIINNNGNVGIGLSNPNYAIDVVGDVNVTGEFRKNGVLFSGGNGGGSQWSNISSNVFIINSNVGIGTSNAKSLLHVVQESNSSVPDAIIGDYVVKSYNISLGTTINNFTNICNIYANSGAFIAHVDVVHSESYSSESATYSISMQYDNTNSNWMRCLPLSATGPSGANNHWQLEAMSSANDSQFRLVRLSGSNSPSNFTCTFRVAQSQARKVTLTYLGTSGTTTASTTTFPSSLLTQTRSNVGIGVRDPTYLLHLSADSAAKPSTTTWTVTSDARMKENIVPADLNLCYDIVKSLPLKRYTWKSEAFDSNQVQDRSKIGWIAQDVESVFPKAVETKQFNEIEDCKFLNADQIYAAMYGAIQKCIDGLEKLDARITRLENA